MKVIDLTHTIRESMPVYPGTEQPRLTTACTVEKDHFRETLLQMFSHTGTHMDAPAHVLAGGKTLDQYPAGQFLGKALVIDCRHLREGQSISMDCLEGYGQKLHQAEFLLFCTGWDRYWGTEVYFGRYPCVDDTVLRFILEGGYKGIGMDTISLDPMASLPRHKKLLALGNTVIIENLTCLEQCGSDLFDFACLPLKTENADGAPVRAVAMLSES